MLESTATISSFRRVSGNYFPAALVAVVSMFQLVEPSVGQIENHAAIGRHSSMEPVELYSDPETSYRSRPVAKLTVKRKGTSDADCTAVLLHDETLITALHCLRGAEVVGVTAMFGYLKEKDYAGTTTFPVNPRPYVELPSLDIALLKFLRHGHRPATEAFGYAHMSDRAPEPRTKLEVYAHPGGSAQKLSRGECRTVPTDIGKPIGQFRLVHSCRTQEGSSGGAIFRASWPWQDLVGIHLRGAEMNSQNYGATIQDMIGQSSEIKEIFASQPARVLDFGVDRNPTPSELILLAAEQHFSLPPMTHCEPRKNRIIRIVADPISSRHKQLWFVLQGVCESGVIENATLAVALVKPENPYELATKVMSDFAKHVPEILEGSIRHPLPHSVDGCVGLSREYASGKFNVAVKIDCNNSNDATWLSVRIARRAG